MLNTKDIAVLSISELTQSIKSLFESQYRFVHIQGEVTNLRIPYSGHMYFTLKDSGAQIRAVLFKGQRRYLAEKIKDGQNIICHGRISVYEPRGEYQILIDTVDFKGTGNLLLQYEKLKKQLGEEGLFRDSSKKNIPPYPEKIVLVTSPTGAAVQDFLKIASIRGYHGRIIVYPVAVQGKNSADQIAKSLEAINTNIAADLIILLRGGGSLEDLWTFNEEKVARAISNSLIPVVTGIGHETDLTIADLCADRQTHTPTAAAEATIPDINQVLNTINSYKKYLIWYMNDKITKKEVVIQQIRRIIGDLNLFIGNHNLLLDHQISALINTTLQRLLENATRLQLLTDRLNRQAPLGKIAMKMQYVSHKRNDITQKITFLLERKQGELAKQAALMESFSPLSVLARGYSIVSRKNNNTNQSKVITSSNQVLVGNTVDIRLNEGELVCQVKKISN